MASTLTSSSSSSALTLSRSFGNSAARAASAAARNPHQAVKSSSPYLALLNTYCSTGDLDNCKKVVQEHSLDTNLGDYDGRTPLHLACSEGHAAIAEWLIDSCKVDINIEDRFGRTPLEDAIDGKHLDVINVLRKKGATFSSIRTPALNQKFFECAAKVIAWSFPRQVQLPPPISFPSPFSARV